MTARPTSLRPAVRRIAVTLALFTGVASAATATAPHASAVGREERTITRTQGMDEGYGPLSAGSSTTPDPAVCLAAGFCDTIPVEIVPPDIPLGDDYYVQVMSNWT